MKRTVFWSSSLLASSMLFASPALGDTTPSDNTGKNKVESPTADQSSNNKSDLQLTADIRRAIMKDSTLSTSAHNVKIVVDSGAVTLKGPVKNADEKTKVAKMAIQIAGATNVKNQLEIAP
jgi:hyperosmotically inducible periplasmic protein